MAVTITNVLAGVNSFVADIVKSADGDTAATVPHGLAATPLMYGGVQTLSQALTALSAWSMQPADGTNLNLTALASTGSGSATKQFRVWAMLPHSIIK